MDTDLLKLIGGGGIAAALLYLIFLVGTRIVAALDRVAAKVDDHTKADLASHADMREQMVRMGAKLDVVLDWGERTPVGVEPPAPSPRERTRSNPRGVPIGEYGLRRDSNKGER